MNSNMNRRTLLKFGLGAAASTIALAGSRAATLGAACVGATPPQTAGPFYPGEKLFHKDSDLTKVPGQTAKTLGQVIYITGKVQDLNCNPIEGALVEIWQACASGKYNNPNDPNPAPLDPNFKYWGEASTDSQGEYMFKTIIPGEYKADENWIRPPHIHYKIGKIGYNELITQMYFKGNPLNEADLILDRVPHNEWDRVIIDFQQATAGLEPSALMGRFDITLTGVRRQKQG